MIEESGHKERRSTGGQHTRQPPGSDESGDDVEMKSPYGDWYRERLQAEADRAVSGISAGDGRVAAGERDDREIAERERVDMKKERPTTVQIAEESEVRFQAQGAPVALSAEAERFLTGNVRELAIVEGRLLGSGDRPKVIGFTSCFDGEGKTTTALGAAYGIGQTGGGRVLLIDGNPARPRLQALFSVPTGPGLSEVFAGEVSVEEALHPTRYKGLEVMTGGSSWAAFGQGMPIAHLRAFLEIVRPAYDCIIMDGGSLFTASDPMLSAPLMDGMVITVACEHTKWEAVQAAADKVRRAGGRVLGVALNRRRYYIPKRVYQWLAG